MLPRLDKLVTIACLGAPACGGTIDDGGALDASADGTLGGDAGVSASCALGSGVELADASPSAFVQFFGDSNGYSGFFAQFVPPVGAWPVCGTVVGPCTLVTDASCPPTPYTPLLNAGTVTIRGEAFGVANVEQEDGGYDPETYVFEILGPDGGTMPIFEPGDPLCVSASGDAYPAFPNLPIVAPAAAMLLQPILDAGADGSSPIAATSDLALAWTGGVAGEILGFYITARPTDGGLLLPAASCEFDAVAGRGTIPQSVMAAFVGQRVIVVWSISRTVTYAFGANAVQLSANAYFGGDFVQVE